MENILDNMARLFSVTAAYWWWLYNYRILWSIVSQWHFVSLTISHSLKFVSKINRMIDEHILEKVPHRYCAKHDCILFCIMWSNSIMFTRCQPFCYVNINHYPPYKGKLWLLWYVCEVTKCSSRYRWEYHITNTISNVFSWLFHSKNMFWNGLFIERK